MNFEPSTLPTAGPEDAVVVEAHRVWSALRANLKQELLAPVDALHDYSRMLVEQARDRGHEGILADLEKIQASCARLRKEMAAALDPSGPPPDESRTRHDLRNHLNAVVQMCEMLLEDAGEALFLEPFVADLREMLDLANQLLRRLGDLFHFHHEPANGTPEVVAVSGLPPRLSAGDVPPAEKGVILVVEDNAALRHVLCRRLEHDGHQAVEAENGRVALRLLEERPFDLVLLDVLMPELGGFETLARLKADARFAHVPVIMISALDEIDCAVRCIERGAEDYLTKPCNPVLLRARIGACLEKKRLRDREVEHLAEIQRGKERVDQLLQVILPRQVVPELIRTGAVRPRHVENVAVLFADVVGFTPYCTQNPPERVVDQLDRLVERWEEIALRHGVLKVKTIGDAFMGTAGLLEAVADSPVLPCVRCGLEMIAATRAVSEGMDLRVGIHLGPVVAGVIGRRQFCFDLWGDTVNTAARMESHGTPGTVVLSQEAWAPVSGRFRGESLVVEVKGKGPMEVIRLRDGGS
jgi:class 3 adenylate cyclase